MLKNIFLLTFLNLFIYFCKLSLFPYLKEWKRNCIEIENGDYRGKREKKRKGERERERERIIL